MKKKLLLPLCIIFLVLLIDQSLKIWVKLNMFEGMEIFPIPGWNAFRLHFVENTGMAFGLAFGGLHGKVALTVFRMVAMVVIGFYLWTIVRKQAPRGLIISIALIFAGALGNIIDSVFYGILFSDSINRVAEFLPGDGGYAPLFHGNVVDMLYFKLHEGFYPDWFLSKPEWCQKSANLFCEIFPWANEHWIFFRPVFNIADASITVGVFMIIVFQKRYFRDREEEQPQEQSKLQDESVIDKTEEQSEDSDSKPWMTPTTDSP